MGKAYKYFGNKKDDKKKKKKKGKDHDRPTIKSVRSTLDKKDAKTARKIVLAPIDVPKDFIKVRNKCNHAGKLITPAEFRDMTAAYAAYTPMLDAICNKYGEERVHVCRDCYDVLVDRDLVTPQDVDDAVLTLYVAANKAVSLKRMKDDEVKAISKLKNEMVDWNDVADIIEKVDEDYAARGGNTASPSGKKINLNEVGNDAQVY